MRILVCAVLLAVACHVSGSDIVKVDGRVKNKMAALLRNMLMATMYDTRPSVFDSRVARQRRILSTKAHMRAKVHNIYTPWLPTGSMSKKNVGDNQVCRMVCTFCRKVASLRVSALCEKQCTSGRGSGFIACFTYWSNREQMMVTRN